MKELVVSVKNQPGELNKIATSFGKAGINILAVALYTIGNEGRIHLAVDNKNNALEKAMKELEKLKYKPTTQDVIMLELKHAAGELARVTKILADANINIELLYGSGSTWPSAQLVLGVADIKKAEKVLGLE